MSATTELLADARTFARDLGIPLDGPGLLPRLIKELESRMVVGPSIPERTFPPVEMRVTLADAERMKDIYEVELELRHNNTASWVSVRSYGGPDAPSRAYFDGEKLRAAVDGGPNFFRLTDGRTGTVIWEVDMPPSPERGMVSTSEFAVGDVVTFGGEEPRWVIGGMRVRFGEIVQATIRLADGSNPETRKVARIKLLTATRVGTIR